MDKNLNKVSILIITKDRANLLRKALDSVFHQTYTDWEIIIVDDRSTDNTTEIIRDIDISYREKIIYIKNQESVGISKSRNIGLDKTTGRYIAILDSDDLWSADKLEKQLDFFKKNPDTGILGTNILIIDQTGKIISQKKYKETDSEIRDVILGTNPFCHSSIIIDTLKFTKKNILYNENLDRWEDYELFLRLGSYDEYSTNTKFANLDEFLTLYRIHNSNISKTKKFYGAILHLRLSLKYLRHYPHPLKWILKNLTRICLTLIKKSKDPKHSLPKNT